VVTVGAIETVGAGVLALDDGVAFELILDEGEVVVLDVVELGRLQAVRTIEPIPINNLKYFTLSNRSVVGLLNDSSSIQLNDRYMPSEILVIT
jgi:hypothetical protein